jgi:hypothetical protein
VTRNLILVTLIVGLSLIVWLPQPAEAHQPFFEGEDITAEAPWEIKDPSISTAIYATLEPLAARPLTEQSQAAPATDVDYYTFEGLEREVILLELTIPQIDGQDEFAPIMALMGPGLAEAELPAHVVRPAGAGALVIDPPEGPANTFFEPFSRTSYWERQEQRVTLPESGRYVVAVWHPRGEVGRYTFVIGEKEVLGGDPAFPFKMRQYWTAVEIPAEKTASDPVPPKHRCLR